MKPATYYDKIYDQIAPYDMERIKGKRESEATTESHDVLRAREKHAHARVIKRKAI